MLDGATYPIKEFTAENEQATMQLASQLARAWLQAELTQQAATVLTLHGDLGAGKTTFTRGFLRACGYQGVVKSPTYTLVEPYSIHERIVYHFDLYRLGDAEELEFTGARDCFAEQSMCLIEWPEKAESALPQADLACRIEASTHSRVICLQPYTERGKLLMLQAFSY